MSNISRNNHERENESWDELTGNFLTKLLYPEFKKEWDELEPEFQLIQATLNGREEQQISQRSSRKKPEFRRKISINPTECNPCW